jgi:hypothetical protein
MTSIEQENAELKTRISALIFVVVYREGTRSEKREFILASKKSISVQR